ncbi:uncharacterized protein ASCRUDRAFT_72299 [Ascoidea rubescens DSM 1968]|uniref:Uncharacterized protein n=1 Tax=Ascoidea rubescens DSM 1968 TaxID=1344418 RepID=A0A1D2VBQ8_9ASCO|nr:hypothetical protein ASCRUDRAFT_72299 [Ascoidea rubescens DSM 1968]ODV58897.1 hypothetical protein ASCRUDRAFT_72299 [Ascoidea rubescens DSM 1968]
MDLNYLLNDDRSNNAKDLIKEIEDLRREFNENYNDPKFISQKSANIKNIKDNDNDNDNNNENENDKQNNNLNHQESSISKLHSENLKLLAILNDTKIINQNDPISSSIPINFDHTNNADSLIIQNSNQIKIENINQKNNFHSPNSTTDQSFFVENVSERLKRSAKKKISYFNQNDNLLIEINSPNNNSKTKVKTKQKTKTKTASKKNKNRKDNLPSKSPPKKQKNKKKSYISNQFIDISDDDNYHESKNIPTSSSTNSQSSSFTNKITDINLKNLINHSSSQRLVNDSLPSKIHAGIIELSDGDDIEVDTVEYQGKKRKKENNLIIEINSSPRDHNSDGIKRAKKRNSRNIILNSESDGNFSYFGDEDITLDLEKSNEKKKDITELNNKNGIEIDVPKNLVEVEKNKKSKLLVKIQINSKKLTNLAAKNTTDTQDNLLQLNEPNQEKHKKPSKKLDKINKRIKSKDIEMKDKPSSHLKIKTGHLQVNNNDNDNDNKNNNDNNNNDNNEKTKQGNKTKDPPKEKFSEIVTSILSDSNKVLQQRTIAKKTSNKKKREKSLGELCSKTNFRPYRVGLSKRVKIDHLHEYLKKETKNT